MPCVLDVLSAAIRLSAGLRLKPCNEQAPACDVSLKKETNKDLLISAEGTCLANNVK